MRATGNVRTSELVQDIRRAVEAGDWRSVGDLARKLLRSQPGHKLARRYLEQAAREIEPKLHLSDFVGRQKELERLTYLLRESAQGPGRLAMLAGEPGIGKTRLAEELASRARDAGVLPLWGRCYEEQGSPPYWPWRQAMRPLLAGERHTLRQAIGPAAPALAAVLPEVRALFPDIEPFGPGSASSAADTFRLHDALSAFLSRICSRRPILLVLEDLHWADSGSLGLLLFVVRELERSHLLILGSYRDVELERRHPLSVLLGELARERPYERHVLQGWSEQETATYVASARGGSVPKESARRIHELTQGNPLFVREMVSLASSSRGVPARLPRGIREVIDRRLDRLSEACNELLAAASVVGQEFGLDVLERLFSGGRAKGLLGALESALRAGIVLESPDAPGRYRFSHAVVREALLEELPLTRRVKLHARVGEALEEVYGEESQEHAAELLGHFARARTVVGGEKVARYALAAAEKALAVLSGAEALEHLRIGLEALEGQEPSTLRAELYASSFAAHAQIGSQPEEVLRQLSLAIDEWTAAGDPGRAPEWIRRHCDIAFNYDEQCLAPGERLCSLSSPGSLEEAEFLAWIGVSRARLGTGGDWEQCLDRAIRIAEQHGDATTVARICLRYSDAARHRQDYQVAIEHGQKALAVAKRQGDWPAAASACGFLMHALDESGNEAESRRHLGWLRAEAERRGDRVRMGAVSESMTYVTSAEADWEQFRIHSARTLEDGRRFRWGPWDFAYVAAMDLLSGDAPGYRNLIQEVDDLFLDAGNQVLQAETHMAWALAAGALLTGDQGDLRRARELAEAALGSRGMNPHWQGIATIALATAAHVAGDRALARKLFDSPQWFIPGSSVAFHIQAGTLGRLALTLGQMDSAVELLEAARGRCQGTIRDRPWATYELGAAYLERHAAGDRARARSLLQEALGLAERYRMPPIAALATKALGRAAPEPGASPQPDGLTDREIEVLRRIARGKSDKEIGFELRISPRTVSHYVGSILRKARCGNRTEAARYALEHGLGGYDGPA